MKIRLGVTAALAGVGLTILSATSAHAYDDPFMNVPSSVVNEQTGRCLDSDTDGNVYTKPCRDGNPYQQWKYTWGNHVENVQTGRCLTAASATAVRTMPCVQNYTPMNWGLVRASGVNGLGNFGLALDSDTKGQVYLKAPTANNRYQSWLWYVA
ncbi:ricin-type beta-trefoil lectin domain protein [Streptomyces sp. NPDC048507]|uniref:RICIN domain-containing protein n=1 Tax=Streptomyces sp. NPDC048507 TaxID=3365560 RepID=UPI00371FEF6C